jgi:hypothetical protein
MRGNFVPDGKNKYENKNGVKDDEVDKTERKVNKEGVKKKTPHVEEENMKKIERNNNNNLDIEKSGSLQSVAPLSHLKSSENNIK